MDHGLPDSADQIPPPAARVPGWFLYLVAGLLRVTLFPEWNTRPEGPGVVTFIYSRRKILYKSTGPERPCTIPLNKPCQSQYTPLFQGGDGLQGKAVPHTL